MLKTQRPLLCEVTHSILTSSSSTRPHMYCFHSHFIGHCSHHCDYSPITIIIIRINPPHFLKRFYFTFVRSSNWHNIHVMLPCYFVLFPTCFYSPYHSYLNRYTIILLFRGGRGKRGGRGGGERGDWSTTNFLGMYCYFPVIRMVNFV